MSWVIAGLATAGSFMASRSANEADKASAEAEKFQTLIDYEKQRSETFLDIYNQTVQLAELEATQDAMASAMGKRTDSASLENIKRVGREDLQENIDRSKEELRKGKMYAKLGIKATERSTKARTTARTINTVTSGLMNFGKAF